MTRVSLALALALLAPACDSSPAGGGGDGGNCQPTMCAPPPDLSCGAACAPADMTMACGAACADMTCGAACADMACASGCGSADLACPGSSCGGSMVNLCSDSANCGACNHDCGGGACVASVCQGVAVDTMQVSPWGVAVDANNVYWTDINTGSTDGTVMQQAKSGGAATALAQMQWAPHDLLVNATGLYWENYSAGEIWKIAPLGATAVNVTTEPAQMVSFTVDGTNAYFVEKGSSVVRKAPLAGGAASSTPLTTPTAGRSPGSLIADGRFVYWVNTVDGSIFATTPDGTTTTTLVPTAGAGALALYS